MSSPRLTTTSYVVLGLIERLQPATVYDLKQLAAISTVNFWPLPHTQLYAESERLARAGLLDEQRERTGRRRRIYRLTEAGADALDAWRAEPTDALAEAFDPATLKLFFGADPGALASAQLDAHRRQLAAYETLAGELDADPEKPRGMRLALECGIGIERQFIRFWSAVAAGEGVARRQDDEASDEEPLDEEASDAGSSR